MKLVHIKCPKGYKKFYKIDKDTFVSVAELEKEMRG